MNKKGNGVAILIFALIVLAFGVYLFYPDTSTIKSNITINKTAILPNVPGDILTNNLTIICVSGYSSTVRNVPSSLRLEVFARDGVQYPQPTGTTELDHIIPLCLGGSNDKNNLFVQFAEPRPGFKEKDKLENYLCDHVCSGEIDINYAQKRIAEDWYSYYKEIYGTT